MCVLRKGVGGGVRVGGSALYFMCTLFCSKFMA